MAQSPILSKRLVTRGHRGPPVIMDYGTKANLGKSLVARIVDHQKIWHKGQYCKTSRTTSHHGQRSEPPAIMGKGQDHWSSWAKGRNQWSSRAKGRNQWSSWAKGRSRKRSLDHQLWHEGQFGQKGRLRERLRTTSHGTKVNLGKR